MQGFNAIFDSLLLLYFWAFSWAPSAVGLAVIAALAGTGMLWVFRRTSDQGRIKAVKNKVWAALFELRVYADEPLVTWRAQRALFAANARYLGLTLRPALWMMLPMALLLVHLESFYGHAPLPLFREAIVTMRMAPGWNPNSAAPLLLQSAQLRVSGAPVRVAGMREVSWRIQPVRAMSGDLVFEVNGQTIKKRIEAGSRQRFVPGRSVHSAMEGLWRPGENRIPSPEVEWIEIRYPEAALSILGMEWNWMLWFLVVSGATALLLKKYFGVVI